MTLKSATTDNSRIEDLFDDVFGTEAITIDLDRIDDIGEDDDEDTVDDDIDDEDNDGSLFDKM